jgi:Flp pilus assembly pilin Flp
MNLIATITTRHRGREMTRCFPGVNSMIRTFLADESGLELSEYAVAAALVALTVILAFTALGTNIGTKIQGLADKIGAP